MTAQPLTIGFLGIGSLGAPIARRIAQKYPLVVHDLNQAKLEGIDAVKAGSPQEVADLADMIFACLGTEADHRAALLGGNGLRHGLRVRTYVHLGTSGPPLVEELASELAQNEIGLLDAPVTGGPPLAQDGALTTIASGRAELIAIARPVIATYSERVIEVGPKAGDAQAAKLVNNAIALTNLTIACEALMVGAKRGLHPASMLEIINHGSGQNSATLTKFPRQILTRRFDFGATLATVIKDLELFIEEAQSQAMPAAISGMALEAFRNAARMGVEIDDLTSVIRPFERLAGVELSQD